MDTCIWIDFLEDRMGFNGEPIGEYAENLFSIIKLQNHTIVITDILLYELELRYSNEQIKGMFNPFIVEKILTTKTQRNEAIILALKRNIPEGDVLHSILARDNNLTLITRDKHFHILEDITNYYSPENALLEFFT